MDARLAIPVFDRGEYCAMWSGVCGDSSSHFARRDVGPTTGKCPDLNAPEAEGWAGICERCGEVIPWDAPGAVRKSSGTKIIWDTPSGDLEPGCLYYEHRGDYDHFCSGHWTNCDQRHLYAILPNGHHWDIDSRAKNCGSPQDFTHRCWVRHGEPPMVHVDKNGQTCTAGAGSILAGNYHGFLHNGQFTGV